MYAALKEKPAMTGSEILRLVHHYLYVVHQVNKLIVAGYVSPCVSLLGMMAGMKMETLSITNQGDGICNPRHCRLGIAQPQSSTPETCKATASEHLFVSDCGVTWHLSS